jgi:hypothetical protein
MKNRFLKESQDAGAGSTQPAYQNIETGEIITPAKIVQKKTKLPKKYRPYSLSNRFKRKSRMKKLSYIIGNDSEVTTPGPAEGTFSTTELGNGGSFKFDYGNLQIEPRDGMDPNKLNPAPMKGEDLDDEDNPTEESQKEVINFLIDLADNMDLDNKESFANFTDFLIVKFAQSIQKDYNDSFNNLIIKIKRMDIPDTNDVVKKLTKIYSRTILIEYDKSKDLEKAKESAYKKALHRANQYLSEV